VNDDSGVVATVVQSRNQEDGKKFAPSPVLILGYQAYFKMAGLFRTTPRMVCQVPSLGTYKVKKTFTNRRP